MQNKEYSFFQDPYLESLKTINDIKFTPKEIDIMACILSGRGRKAIGSLLTISEKTVETHIRNVSQKLGCNSQEAIRDYLEKSNKFAAIRDHYLSLLTNGIFEKHLQKISTLAKTRGLTCSLLQWEEILLKPFINQLEKHLILSGIQTSARANKDYKLAPPFPLSLKNANTVYIFFIFQTIIEEPQKGYNRILKSINELAQKESSLVVLLLKNNEILPNDFLRERNIQCIFFNNEKNYYSLFFNLLKKIFFDLPLSEIILSFKKQYAHIHKIPEKNLSQPEKISGAISKITFSYTPTILSSLRRKKKLLLIMVGSLCFTTLSIYLQLFNIKLDRKGSILELLETHSGLMIPGQEAYLDRPELIAQIESAFKEQHLIRTVVLVGIGGIGKTTLARQFAQQQNSSIVWEINAETKESLCESFENLSLYLSKTPEDQKILQGLKEIKNATEREEKLLQFVKKHLISLPNWFLIYDNVERFTDIKNYFPTNSVNWGTGKIILTTRNSTIHNNPLVHHIILMPDLTLEQKLTLFLKIMGKGKKDQENLLLKEKEFLQEIPSFPLDISITAYYLKMTNISYEKYINRLKESNKYFYSIQGSILREIGDYKKTRYGIISISLQHIIEGDKNFEELLLFISLLDSQDISKDLLDFYKNEIVVDNFIYHLKKHSFIINERSSSSLGPIFSIHRSTQETSASYLIKTLDRGKKNQFIREISDTIENYIADIIEKEDTSRMKLLISHSERFLHSINLLNENISGPIESKLGCIYLHLGYYKQAKLLLEKSLLNFNKFESKNYAKITWSLDYLGEAYNDIGNYEKAREVLEQSLLIYNKHFPGKYDGIAHTLERLGNVYEGIGNYEKSRELLEKSLSIYKKYCSDSYSGLARTLGRLGNVYRDLGEFEKARDCDEQSLAIYKKYFPENKVRIARQLSGLGNIYKYLGNYEKAKSLLEESLVIYTKELPPNHIYTTWAFIFLGNVYKKLENYEKAKELLEKNFIICENHYGKDHVKIAEILRDLGEIYLSMNDTENSEELLLKSLEIFQINRHPECYTSLESLADLYIKKLTNIKKKIDNKKFLDIQKKTIHYLEKALKIAEINFPKSSPHIFRLRSKLIDLKEKTEKKWEVFSMANAQYLAAQTFGNPDFKNIH